MTDAGKESRIVVDPNVRFGHPVIQGTRITVENVLRLAAMGLSIAEIVKHYPHLTEQDVLAANAYAADHLRDAFQTPPVAAQ